MPGFHINDPHVTSTPVKASCLNLQIIQPKALEDRIIKTAPATIFKQEKKHLLIPFKR